MPSLSIKLKTVSPLFLNGADKNQPELRAASVRGQLRYWFRAIEGAKTQDLQKLWEVEEAVFGSTQHGSQVSVRFFNPDPEKEIAIASNPLLPHRTGEREKSYTNAIIDPPQKQKEEDKARIFILQLVSRPGQDLPYQASNALLVWLMLGGLGKRSRRMMGALDSDMLGKNRPNSPNALINLISMVLNDVLDTKKLPTLSVPSFPTLHPNHSRIVIGRKDFRSAQEANIALFSILRSNEFRQHERVFGHAMQGRRASPLIAQVRKIGGAYYPVLTIMRSSDLKDREWGILNDFMSRCEKEFNGETVWGGRLAK
ncbi:MAG: type III-B CRISPR module RAMP protein Cmr1 [Anaerolineae bacterium]|nr:type III-B CRISPR module RAMP protein Cmr1 [Anaerolineae bacterium]